MDFCKRCLPHAIPSTDDRGRDDRGTSRKPEHLGPIRKVPPLLGGEEGSDGRRIRARGRSEGDPSPRHSYPSGCSHLLSARPLSEPKEESRIHRVHVVGLDGKKERYVHDKDVQFLESTNSDAWQPRMSILAPFDNLICDRSRANRIFGFDYLHENFLPQSKRKFGTFVHPILYGDRLIGRADLRMDRKNEKLLVNSVHAERGAPGDKEVSSEIRQTIQQFAEFLQAKEVVYTARVPAAWKNSLR